jgi:hypothetical protein
MNIEWNVVNMERKTDNGFVVTVHYTVTTVDGEVTASTYGTVGYTQEEDNFTPFEQLTKDQVVGWVQTSLDKDAVEASLATQIEALKNPVQESGLPW